MFNGRVDRGEVEVIESVDGRQMHLECGPLAQLDVLEHRKVPDILDRIARTLGLDPHEVRERNFYREGDFTHYGQAVKDAARIGRIWTELKESSAFEARLGVIEAFNAANPHAKRGIAITPAKFGISFTATFLIRQVRSF